MSISGQSVLFVIYIPNDALDVDSIETDDDVINEDDKGEDSSSSSSSESDHDNTDDKKNTSGTKDNEKSATSDHLQAAEENDSLLKSDTSDSGLQDSQISFSAKPSDLKGVKSLASIKKAADSEIFTISEILQSVLQSLSITSDAWKLTDDDNFQQISFVAPQSEVDKILRRLDQYGIGVHAGTSVTIFPASYHVEGTEEDVTEDTRDNVTSKKNEELGNFMKSVKSRLTVAQVIQGVRQNALLTFDYVFFIVIASIIAGLGLAENNSVILVASMLVSPIMGPIMSGTFGFAIQNKELCKIGIRNELIGLAICLVCGFLLGLITSVVGPNWGSVDSWPTPEMKGRGIPRSLWVGVLIALPSGAGVALSVVGGNAGSLVGVAISASLLPPAVNAGMLWALSLVSAISPPALDQQYIPTPVYVPPVVNTNSSINQNDTINTAYTTTPANATVGSSGASVSNATRASMGIDDQCYPPLLDNAYEFYYTCSMTSEAVILGFVSLLLTLLNIFCIFLMGIIVLKVKEVAPHTAVLGASEVFWKKYVPAAREAYKTMNPTVDADLAKMAKEMAKEWKDKDILGVDGIDNDDDGAQLSPLKEQQNLLLYSKILEELNHDNVFRYVNHTTSYVPARTSIVDDSVLPDRPFTPPVSPMSPVHPLAMSWSHTQQVQMRRAAALARHPPQRPLPSPAASTDGRHRSGQPESPQKEVNVFLPDSHHKRQSRGFIRQISCPTSTLNLPEKRAAIKKSFRDKAEAKGRFVITTIPEKP